MPRIRLGRIVLLAVSFCVFVGAEKCDEKEAPKIADEMIEGFAASCNLGNWTRAALERANTITSVYQALQNKASCKDNANLQRALGAATGMQAELRAIQADEARQRERKMEEASNDLLIALADPTLHSSIKDGLMGYYATARYELSIARADVNYINNPGYKARMTLGLERVNSHMRDLLAASQSLGDCYKDNPSVAIQLGSSLAELGGAFAPPMIGLGISAVSNLIKLAVEAARLAPSAEAIYEQRKQRMPIAMACGMEAIARDYCKAKDARLLITTATKDQNRQLLPFFYGIDLADRHLPMLYSWLDRVVNGTTDNVRDPDQAAKIALYMTRLTKAGNAKNSVNAAYSEFMKKLSRGADLRTEQNLTKTLLRDFIKILFPCMDNSGNAAACTEDMFYGGESSVDFLKGIVPDGSLQGETETAAQLINNLNLPQGAHISIMKNFERVYQLRYDQVRQDFNENVNVDLSSLVRDASRMDMEELSAMSAIERLFTFLEKYAYEEGRNGERDKVIINQLRGRVDKVYQQLLDPNSVSDEPVEVACPDPEQPAPGRTPPRNEGDLCYDVSPAAKTISVAFDTFKLDKKNVYLPSAMRGLIRTDLTTRFLRGEAPKQLRDIFRLAGQDLSLLLNRSNLTPAQVLADISAAQSLSSRNATQFRDFFAPALGAAMKDLWTAAEEFREPPAGDPAAPNRNLLSQLCVLTYISGMQWPAQVNFELCRDAMLVSREAGLRIGMQQIINRLHDKSFDERICEYEEFLRLDRLANLGLKKPGERTGPRGFVDAAFGFFGAGPEGEEVEANRAFWQQAVDSRQ